MRDIFTPSLIWDLALIAVILFVMIRSVGRGFVSSFIHLLGLAAGAQNFWVFCKERLDRSKKEKNHRVGFNSHQ